MLTSYLFLFIFIFFSFTFSLGHDEYWQGFEFVGAVFFCNYCSLHVQFICHVVKLRKSFVEKKSSSSSTITTLCEGLSSSLKKWFSLKTKLEKYKKLNTCKRSLLYFIFICFFSSVEKIIIKVNKIIRIWLVN